MQQGYECTRRYLREFVSLHMENMTRLSIVPRHASTSSVESTSPPTVWAKHHKPTFIHSGLSVLSEDQTSKREKGLARVDVSKSNSEVVRDVWPIPESNSNSNQLGLIQVREVEENSPESRRNTPTPNLT